MHPASILVVEDEARMRRLFELILASEGYELQLVPNGAAALRALADSPHLDLIITDLQLGPGPTGMDVLDAAKRLLPTVPVLIVTGYGTVKSAVEAMQKGAYDYIAKPIDNDELKIVVARALELHRLTHAHQTLTDSFAEDFGFDRIVSRSPAMAKLKALARDLARTDTTVLLIGESGTGKELFARAIHSASPRAKGPLIAVNCAGIPESLIESELFGYEKGAFTDAKRSKPGRFQLANHGTLFLDEVGELSPSAQASLLRALETRRIEPLGGVRSQPVDIRVIAATNRALPRLIQEGRFREDLYYRLNVCQLEVPPLRDRREDIAPLLQAFLDEARRQRGARLQRCTPDAIALLQAYAWPGNVREVHNLVEWLTITCHDSQADVEHLPSNITAAPPKVGPTPLQNSESLHAPAPPRRTPLHDKSDDGPLTSLLSLGLSAVELERRLIHEALERCHGNISEAARLLNMTRNTLRYRLTKHGRSPISPPN